ncbi:hypothetical protein [Lacticaseibacillus sp. N501-2]|uniref:hypothetical protein n=1 Tax=Lacticaseibacillus salsurae TaxID=3367729 RepID=UPI0038B27CB9
MTKPHFLMVVAINLFSNSLMFAVMTAAQAHWLATLLAEKIVIGLALINLILIVVLIYSLIIYVAAEHHREKQP